MRSTFHVSSFTRGSKGRGRLVGVASPCTRRRVMAADTTATRFLLAADSRWMIEVAGFDPALEPTIEAVLALVNGYSGTRAALEEGHSVSRPATFIAGIFNTPVHPQALELEQP